MDDSSYRDRLKTSIMSSPKMQKSIEFGSPRSSAMLSEVQKSTEQIMKDNKKFAGKIFQEPPP